MANILSDYASRCGADKGLITKHEVKDFFFSLYGQHFLSRTGGPVQSFCTLVLSECAILKNSKNWSFNLWTDCSGWPVLTNGKHPQ